MRLYGGDLDVSAGDVLTLVSVPLVLLLVFYWLVGLLLGYPRLSVGADGVKFEHLGRSKWAAWDSLSAFNLLGSYSKHSRQTMSAIADITGKNVSRNLLWSRQFTIPNMFTTDLETIADHINKVRLQMYAEKGIAVTPPEPPAPPVGIAGPVKPWLSFSIIVFLTAVFICELLFSVGGAPFATPSVTTLLALGGLNGDLVFRQGEWYRIFTGPLLHGDIVHLLFNSLALLFGGLMLERLVGRIWFFVFFTVGAIGGAMMSLAVNPSNITSIGASGAMMGLFAAACALSFRYPPGRARMQMWTDSLRLLIPSLLPLAQIGVHVDYAAHVGGALGGGALGFILVKNWPSHMRLPPGRKLAEGLAMLAVLLTGIAIAAVVYHYPVYSDLPVLIPAGEYPKGDPAKAEIAEDLAARYPYDPRAHIILARMMIKHNDLAGAERELRTAMKLGQTYNYIFGKLPENMGRAALAMLLFAQNRQDEGRNIVKPICSAPPEDGETQEIRENLKRAGICE
ncbi:MAG: rhomboid family intramembrane serine protease [Bdellovibrionales bacterium]